MDLNRFESKNITIYHGKTDRAKACALLHLFYSIIIVFDLRIYMVINGNNEETEVPWEILFIILFGVCFFVH